MPSAGKFSYLKNRTKAYIKLPDIIQLEVLTDKLVPVPDQIVRLNSVGVEPVSSLNMRLNDDFELKPHS